MTPRKEKRRHSRCNLEREIVFSTGSQTKLHHGVTKNYSRFSLYFESETAFVPGTLLFIRTKIGDPAGSSDAAYPGGGVTFADLDDIDRNAVACSELKNIVVGQVKRCVEITDSGETVYGTGVAYISPAV